MWVDTLPGYRSISTHYQVSDRSSKQAILLLEKRGVIEPTQRGKKRKISENPSLPVNQPVKKEKMRLLIITDSMIPLNGLDELLLHKMSVFWLQRSNFSGEVHRVSGDLGQYKRPGKLLKQWVEQHAATHLLFEGPPTQWIKAVIALGLPCYYLGGELGNPEIKHNVFSGSSQSLSHTLKQVTKRLSEMGHNHLLIPLEYGKRGLQKPAQDALYEIHHGALSREECELSVPVFPEFTPDAWLGNWGREFSRRRPTCVITYNTFALQSLYVFCDRNHIRIGKDLSLICMHSDPILNWYFPRPTYLEYPYSESLKDFKNWVRSDFPQREHTMMEMIWNEGETLVMSP